MTSTTDLVLRASRRLADEYSVDASLDDRLRELPQDEPAKAVQVVGRLLEERVRALQEAAGELSRLRGQLASMVDTLPYTESGWPERKRQLEQHLASDLHGGLSTWINDWATATARGLTDALQRLVNDVSMPACAQPLRDRYALALTGVERSDWNLARPILWALASGIHDDPRMLPNDHIRGGLWALLARLALKTQRLDEASEALDAGAALLPTVTIEALRSRLLRLRGDLDGARERLDAARAADPTDLDVAIEMISQAEGEMKDQMALEVARLTIDAFSHLSDGERELRPLFDDVPGAIWLAVAERAFREEDFERCEWAAAAASKHSEPERILAAIADLRAQAASMRGAPGPDRAAALIDLGRRWLWAGEPGRAQEPLEGALALEPGNEQGLLFLANTLTAKTEAEPIAAVKGEIERALNLIATAHHENGSSPIEAWGYAIECNAHLLLSPGIGPEAETHPWNALEAACLGLVNGRGLSIYWEQLAAAAGELQLMKIAELAGREALALDPDSVRAKVALGAALLSQGRLDEALEYAANAPIWSAFSKAFVAVRKGRSKEAVLILRGLDPLPSMPWFSDLLIDALFFGLGPLEALEEATMVRSRLASRHDEYSARLVTARVEMMCGHYARANSLLEPLMDGRRVFDPSSLRGRIQLLQGDNEAGIASLVEAMGHASPVSLVDWKLVVMPELKILAERASMRLPDLGAVAKAIEAREIDLARNADPIDELGCVPIGLADSRVADRARSLCASWIHLARGEAESAQQALDTVAPPSREDTGYEALRALTRSALAAKRQDGKEDEHPFALEATLPPSWFSGDSDPANTHPLLVRFIPEMRARAGWSVPGVQVGLAEELEPDRYRLQVQGEVAGEGRLDPDRSYLPLEAAIAFGLSDQETAPVVEVPGLPPVVPVLPEALAGSQNDLAQMLALPTPELIARHLGAIVDEHAEALGRPPLD